MTVTLELSAEQELRLQEGAARRDAAAVREVLLQAIDSTVAGLLEHRPLQPNAAEFRVLLDQLAAEGIDSPSLDADAVSRAGIYGDHP